MKTIADLVCTVQERATAMGMDVSPSDVGFIISMFFEGLIHHESAATTHELNVQLQLIADAAAAVTNE